MSHGVKYGVLAGVIGAAYLFLLQVSGLMTSTPMQLLAIIIWVAAIVLAHISYKKANQGVMGYGKGLLIGIVVAAISTLITRAYLYIHLEFIDSELLDYTLDRQAYSLEQFGMGPEEIEQALTGWSASIPGFVLIGVATGIIFGVILSLIVAAITRKKA